MAQVTEQIRSQAQGAVHAARSGITDASGRALDWGRSAASGVNRQVYDTPWAAVGVAVGVGMILGALIGLATPWRPFR